ncbi:MAG: autotransporter domain-containing protein, partial [Alphaproteobacteria bacterium]|nr:autotransporter domain-containing protein [Alphaproteobacteria bacterium]
FGVGVKGGYNYALTSSWTLQPNIYAGYTLVSTEDYTSKSGVRIYNDDLNFFEIDPGFKLSKQINKGWSGYIQGKYAIVADNGRSATTATVVLPEISTKNYFEYGFGMNKTLNDDWSLNGEINRRDGGRSGWNGSLELKYHF